MRSMSYCRFENTYGELEECLLAMNNAESLKQMKLNEYELSAFKAMRALAQEYLEEFDRLTLND